MPTARDLIPMNFDMDDPKWSFNAVVNTALAQGKSPEEINQGTTRTVQSPKGNEIEVTDLTALGQWGQGAMDPETRQQVNEEVQSLARKSRRQSRTAAAAVAAAAAGGAALAGGTGGGASAGASAGSSATPTASGMLTSPGFTLTNVGADGLGLMTSAAGVTPGVAAGAASGANALSTVSLPSNAVPMSTGAASGAGAAGSSAMASLPPNPFGAGAGAGNIFSRGVDAFKSLSFTEKLLAASYGTQALGALLAPSHSDLVNAEAEAAKRWRGAFYGMEGDGGGYTADQLPLPRERARQSDAGPGGGSGEMPATSMAMAPQAGRNLISMPASDRPSYMDSQRGSGRSTSGTGGTNQLKRLIRDSQEPLKDYERLKLPEPGAMSR